MAATDETVRVGSVCEYGVIESVREGVARAVSWQLNCRDAPVAELSTTKTLGWRAVPAREVVLPYATWAEMVRGWGCPLIDEARAFSYLLDYGRDSFTLVAAHPTYGYVTNGQEYYIPRIAVSNIPYRLTREAMRVVPGDFVLHEGEWHKLIEVAYWKAQQPGWTGRIEARASPLALVVCRLANGSGDRYRYSDGLLRAPGKPPLSITATADGIVLRLTFLNRQSGTLAKRSLTQYYFG